MLGGLKLGTWTLAAHSRRQISLAIFPGRRRILGKVRRGWSRKSCSVGVTFFFLQSPVSSTSFRSCLAMNEIAAWVTAQGVEQQIV